MKPTEEQILRVIAAYQNNVAAIEDAMHEAIQKWESLRPKDDPDRWIPLTERRPTAEDHDEHGHVLFLFDDRTIGCFNTASNLVGHTHWRRTNLPQPTAEEIEEKEIQTAWDNDHDLDSFKAGWLACKSKLKTPQTKDLHQTTP